MSRQSAVQPAYAPRAATRAVAACRTSWERRGLHAKNLYNDYVYFWRWALREVFEQRDGPGVVSFVTASSYLRGPGFAGMRRLLRRLLDELWIVDLEGDHLAARRTDNVFPIRTPVPSRWACATPPVRTRAPASVHYARLDGSRAEKLAALEAMQRLTDVPWHAVPAGWSLPLVPRGRGDYASWPKLTDLFPRQLSGAQLKRTWPIAPTPAVLRERWEKLLRAATEDRSDRLQRNPRPRPRFNAGRPLQPDHASRAAAGARPWRRLPRASSVRLPQLRSPVGAARRAAG